MPHQTYTVVKKFTYKGRMYDPGKGITVDKEVGEWMAKQGYVKSPTTAPKKSGCGPCRK